MNMSIDDLSEVTLYPKVYHLNKVQFNLVEYFNIHKCCSFYIQMKINFWNSSMCGITQGYIKLTLKQEKMM